MISGIHDKTKGCVCVCLHVCASGGSKTSQIFIVLPILSHERNFKDLSDIPHWQLGKNKSCGFFLIKEKKNQNMP